MYDLKYSNGCKEVACEFPQSSAVGVLVLADACALPHIGIAVAGGAARDGVLCPERVSRDIDVAVFNATPEEFQEVVRLFQARLVGRTQRLDFDSYRDTEDGEHRVGCVVKLKEDNREIDFIHYVNALDVVTVLRGHDFSINQYALVMDWDPEEGVPHQRVLVPVEHEHGVNRVVRGSISAERVAYMTAKAAGLGWRNE